MEGPAGCQAEPLCPQVVSFSLRADASALDGIVCALCGAR